MLGSTASRNTVGTIAATSYFSFKQNRLYLLVRLFTYACVGQRHVHMLLPREEVKGQLMGISSLLPP